MIHNFIRLAATLSEMVFLTLSVAIWAVIAA